jgi:NADP-dependent 3-hydroxy acid dehydrogenase YdfG
MAEAGSHAPINTSLAGIGWSVAVTAGLSDALELLVAELDDDDFEVLFYDLQDDLATDAAS